MKKGLKITGIIFGVLIILIIALPFIFKSKIVELVKTEINESVNAKVDFDGFSLTLFRSFPDFSLEIQGMTVVGEKPFEGDTFASIQNIFFELDLASVLSGNYKINSIAIENPRIYTKVLRNGKANWDIAKVDSSEVSSTSQAEEDDVDSETASSEDSQFQMQLQRFSITNAYIVYNDLEGNMYAKIDNLNLNLSGDFTESITDIDLNSSIAAMTYRMDGVKYLNKAKMNFNANIIANLDSSKYTFNKNLLKVNGLGLAFDGFVAMPGDNIVMDLKYQAHEASFKSLLSMIPAIYTTDFEGLKTSGKFSMNGWAKGVYNEINMPAFGLNLKVKDAMFQYPDLPKKVDNINMLMTIVSPSSDMDKMKIDVDKFHISMAGNPMDIKLKLRTPMSDPDIDAQFKGKFDLASLQQVYPLDDGMAMNGIFTADLAFKGKQSALDKGQYSKFKASGSLKIKGMDYKDADLPEGVHISEAQMDFTPRYVDLSEFNMTYNKNTLNANGKLRNYIDYAMSDGTLKGSLSVSADVLDLNQLMGAEPSAPTASSNTSSASTASDNAEETAASVEEDMEVFIVPDNIDFTIQATFGRMKYDDLTMKTVYGKLRVAESRVKIEDFHMDMLDGSMIMNGYYSTLDPDTPEVGLVLGITKFDITKSYNAFVAIQKFAPIAKSAHGSYSTILEFKSDLDSKMEPVLNSVNARGLLSLSKIEIKGSKTLSELAKSLNYDKLNDVKTNAFDVPFKVENGKLSVKRFNVEVDDIPMTIEGSISLNQDIDYDVDMQIPREKLGSDANKMINSLVSQANAAGIDASVGETINVKAKITGTSSNPKVSLNYKEAAQDVKDQIKEEAQKQIDDLKKQAQEEYEKQKEELERKAKEEYEKQKAALEKKKKEEEEKAKKKLEEEANKLLDDWF